MTELFGPCLQSSAAGNFSQWKQLHHFGEQMPESLGGDPNTLLFYSLLEANDSEESGLNALTKGILSTTLPRKFLRELELDIEPPDEVESDKTLTLYMEPSLERSFAL